MRRRAAGIGFILGGILGLVAGPLMAGVYDGYLTAEHERRKREKHR